jgi:hypothetical protein
MWTVTWRLADRNVGTLSLIFAPAFPYGLALQGGEGLHVEPIEAAPVAGRIDAGEMHGAHAQSLEIVQRLTL